MCAFAHGFVSQIIIDGSLFKGNIPKGKENPSIICLINTTSPVKDATNPDVNCGPSAHPAATVGKAMPSSQLEFTWNLGNRNWPHNTGPITTYMASCGLQTCDKFDSTKAKGFKIDQQVRTDGKWIQADVMEGCPVKLTLPKTLAPGNYLVRHEIIALHLANSKGGAKFYPSCAQLIVGGTQRGFPPAEGLVSFPGTYTDSDPGIFTPKIFDPDVPYQFPGPPIAVLAPITRCCRKTREFHGSQRA